MLPVSNVGGNNQTTPSMAPGGPKAQPIFTPFQPSGGGADNPNPYLSNFPTAVPGSTPGGAGANPAGFYDTSSSYSSGQTNIDKQLVDIFGKGVGGSLNQILQQMSGTDSEVFKQWLAGMQPLWQKQQTQLGQSEGAAGVSANSSVAGIAEADLAAQQSAQASQENSQIIEQNLQDTIGILTGTENKAAQEVASSGWSVFADVMKNITGDVGALFGGSGPSPTPNVPSGFGGMSPQEISGATGYYGSGSGINTQLDTSADNIFL